MKTRQTYCSACDRDVMVAFPEETDFVDGQANISDPEIVCFEIGHRCTGAMCPVGGLPPAVMAVRLMRSGLDPTLSASDVAAKPSHGDQDPSAGPRT